MLERTLLCLLLAGLWNTATGQDYRLETVADDLSWPWSIAFLPDGSLLVAELDGQLRRIGPNGKTGPDIENLPEVYFAGQGGLFDVTLHPGFEENQRIYLSYAEGTPGDNGTAVARARLAGNAVQDVEVIFRTGPRKKTPVHYGGRMAFLEDGTLLLTTGDGFNYREAAQDKESQLGKIIRIHDDGTPPKDNPFPESPYVWSYGHRNPQGLAVSRSGLVYMHEHGPRGGDELNLVESGVNYGWPAITYGLDYSGAVISPYTEWEGMAQPVHYWVPSIGPSGLAIYEGELFPRWRGNLFVGALINREVRRIELEDGRAASETPMFGEIGQRIRDVRTGPDGALYIVTDGTAGKIIKVLPER